MSAPLGTRPAVGRKVWYRRTVYSSPRDPAEQDWLEAEVLRVSPAGKCKLKVKLPSGTTFVVERVSNGIKPGQWCGWADDLWLPSEGGELMRGVR